MIRSKSNHSVEQGLKVESEVDKLTVHKVCRVELVEVMVERHVVLLELQVFLKIGFEGLDFRVNGLHLCGIGNGP